MDESEVSYMQTQTYTHTHAKWRKREQLTLTFLAMTAAVYAASPQEEFTQMVGELQKAPTDTVLLEKIIKFASTMKHFMTFVLKL